jgi:alcohol dehydrogenase (cytochrome c)
LRPSERREPANDNFCRGFSGEKVPPDPGKLSASRCARAPIIDEVQAWDPTTGKKI